MKIYMAVDSDEYELPYAVADTAEELARLCGVKKNTVISSISQLRRGKTKSSRYLRIEVEGEDE